MLQTLSDMTDDEIDRLIRRTAREVDDVGNDYRTTMRLLGATEYNKNPSWFQQALMLYPELFRDQYCREVIKQTRKSLSKQAKAGRLRVNGGYTFVSPDLYAFSEWLFLGIQNPNGLLKNGEVYYRNFDDGDELACLRSPHLYREWPIRTNTKNDETDRWFGCTQCIYTSTFDTISKILQFDCDGDKLLVIRDNLLTKIAKRNMQDIVPLAYELKKATGGILTSETMYEGMIHSYTGGNIGPISNNISRVWNSEEIGKEQLDVVKWLTYINNQVIDYAKTLWRADPPKEVNETIKKYTKRKLPNFFIYAKDKTDDQVELPNNSTMNRISAKIPPSRIKFCKTVGKFDYRMLMNQNVGFTMSDDSAIIKAYEYYNLHQYLFNTETENSPRQEDMFMFQEIRRKIIEQSEASTDYIVNTLVVYLYTVKPNLSRKILWASFGDLIVENLRQNTKSLGKICQICGKRFTGKQENYTYCSDECRMIARREYFRKNNM